MLLSPNSTQNTSQSMPRGTDNVYAFATRSTEFWFSDGSIVLLAQSTTFKVHTTLLHHSAQLTSMIQALPRDGIQVDGCLCLQLDDDADDVRDFLSIIYHTMFFDSINVKTASLGTIIRQVGGILRMSNKYEAIPFRSKCIAILTSYIDTALPFYNVFPNPFSFRDLVSAINLAEQTHVPSILPPLYYSMTAHYPIDCAELSWRTRAACMSGGFALFSLFRTRTHSFLFNFKPSANCIERCFYRSNIDDFQAAHKAYLHAGVLRPIDEDDLERMNICSQCEGRVLTQNTEGREYVIQRLPELFGLQMQPSDDIELDDATANRDNTPKPHPEFWYPDGSIVLIVGCTMYRVHRSRLIANSEIFADMFDLPTSEYQDMDFVSGQPSVVLHDDEKDFTLLLRALEVPMYFEDYTASNSLAKIMTVLPGILRLSTKYGISSIRQKCIRLLAAKFVTTLVDYDLIAGSNEVYADQDVITVINLAEVTNIPEILPHALFIMTDRACTYSLSPPLSANKNQLSWRVKAMCMSARQKTMWAFYNTTHPFLFKFKRADFCTGNCRFRTRPQDWERLWGDRVSHLLGKMHDLDWNVMNLCPRCRVSSQKQHATGRNIIWDQLPSLFGFGSWDEIKHIQALD